VPSRRPSHRPCFPHATLLQFSKSVTPVRVFAFFIIFSIAFGLLYGISAFTFEGCGSTGTEIAFVLDASGSIGQSSFLLMKNFIKTVVGAFDVGQDKNQFSVIPFGSSVNRVDVIKLNKYWNKASVSRINFTSFVFPGG